MKWKELRVKIAYFHTPKTLKSLFSEDELNWKTMFLSTEAIDTQIQRI